MSWTSGIITNFSKLPAAARDGLAWATELAGRRPDAGYHLPNDTFHWRYGDDLFSSRSVYKDPKGKPEQELWCSSEYDCEPRAYADVTGLPFAQSGDLLHPGGYPIDDVDEDILVDSIGMLPQHREVVLGHLGFKDVPGAFDQHQTVAAMARRYPVGMMWDETSHMNAVVGGMPVISFRGLKYLKPDSPWYELAKTKRRDDQTSKVDEVWTPGPGMRFYAEGSDKPLANFRYSDRGEPEWNLAP